RKVIGKSKEAKVLIKTIKNKLSIAVYFAFGALFIAGLFLTKSSGQTGGAMFAISFDTPYTTMLSVKLFLYFAVIGISVFRSRFVDKLKTEPPKKEKLNMLLLIINLAMGVIIFIISAQLTAFVKFYEPP
ncbi:MAG: hypothetical protein ACTSXU_04195, partial [Promethearchaeota archaeon]